MGTEIEELIFKKHVAFSNRTVPENKYNVEIKYNFLISILIMYTCNTLSHALTKKSSPALDHVKVKVKSLSRVHLFATLWTVACQALPSMGFSRQEYWSGLPLPSPPAVPNQ